MSLSLCSTSGKLRQDTPKTTTIFLVLFVGEPRNPTVLGSSYLHLHCRVEEDYYVGI